MNQSKKDFDYRAFEKQALEKLKAGEPLEGKEGVMAPLIKRFLEAALEGELDSHLQDGSSAGNRRNGKTSKEVKTSYGSVRINTSRDRAGTFSPSIIPKRCTTLGASLDNKVISLYAAGMSYRDICTHLEEMFGLLVSPATLTAITDRVIEEVKEWQGRPLESLYPFIWLDGIYYKVREHGGIRTKAIYTVIGITRDGIKELLGLYVGREESARFWLKVLSDLRQRGVQDVFFACTDNLRGMDRAIKSIFPNAVHQLCLIHQVRNSTRHIPCKDRKAVSQSLQNVYKAASKDQAEVALAQLEKEWGSRYPAMVNSWLTHWEPISHYFQYPPDIRRIIYTTNIIESVHSQFRKVTKSKRVFSSDLALEKLLYLVTRNISKKWTRPVNGWNLVHAQLTILFEERLKAP